MPKRSSIKRSRSKDENVLAKNALDFIIEETESSITEQELHVIKNQAAVLLGRLGGLKGGKARAEKLSPERRKEIASNAAKARWSNSSDE